MVLDVSAATGAMTGAGYIESLRDGREVWLDGARVKDVTTHPAFTGMVHELARIYDLQHADGYREEMTFVSPETGNRCSLSWLLPRSMEDLKRQRRNSEVWNEQCWCPGTGSLCCTTPFRCCRDLANRSTSAVGVISAESTSACG